jgi:hypothetical protein
MINKEEVLMDKNKTKEAKQVTIKKNQLLILILNSKTTKIP